MHYGSSTHDAQVMVLQVNQRPPSVLIGTAHRERRHVQISLENHIRCSTPIVRVGRDLEECADERMRPGAVARRQVIRLGRDYVPYAITLQLERTS